MVGLLLSAFVNLVACRRVPLFFKTVIFGCTLFFFFILGIEIMTALTREVLKLLSKIPSPVHIFFIRFLCHDHLGCFQVLAVVSNAMNVVVQSTF